MSLKTILGKLVMKAGVLCLNCCYQSPRKYCFRRYSCVWDCDAEPPAWGTVDLAETICVLEEDGPEIIGIWYLASVVGNTKVYHIWIQGSECTVPLDCPPGLPPDPPAFDPDCPASTNACGICELKIGSTVKIGRPTFTPHDTDDDGCDQEVTDALNSLPNPVVWEITEIDAGRTSAVARVVGHVNTANFSVEPIVLTCDPPAGISVANASIVKGAWQDHPCQSGLSISIPPITITACGVEQAATWVMSNDEVGDPDDLNTTIRIDP